MNIVACDNAKLVIQDALDHSRVKYHQLVESMRDEGVRPFNLFQNKLKPNESIMILGTKIYQV